MATEEKTHGSESDQLREKVTEINFYRLRYIIPIILVFSLLSLIIDFTLARSWEVDHLRFFRNMDVALLIISFTIFLLFKLLKNKQPRYKRLFIHIAVFSLLNWAAIITGIDFSSFGISTLIIILISIVFLLYLELIHAIIYFSITLLSFSLTIYFMGDLVETHYMDLTVIYTITIISVFLTNRNYRNKIADLKQTEQLQLLNRQLEKSKDNLEKEVENRTKALIANENVIRETRDRFTALVNNLQSGVFYINTAGEIIELNPAILKILGSPSAEYTKKINLLEFEPLKKAGYANKLKECIESEEIIFGEADYTSAWGKTSRVNYYFVPIKENNVVVGVLANIEDVSEQKRSEEKLVFQTVLLDNINDYILASDLEGNITYANKIVRDSFDLQDIEKVKQHLSLLGQNPHEGATHEQILKETRKNGRWRGEVVYYTANGDKIIMDCRTQILNDNVNNPYGIIIISTDITAAKRHEKEIHEINLTLRKQNDEYENLNKKLSGINQELRIAKENAEKSDQLKTAFLNNMSHEIRTPMNGIIGFSKFLTNPDLSLEKRKTYAQIVNNSSSQLLKVIDDILEISTLETKQVKVTNSKFDLKDLLMELFSIFDFKAKEKGISLYLKTDHPKESNLVNSDKTKLHKILSNLIENALKFTMKGYVEIGSYVTNGNIYLYVKDTGIGISEENKELIFERFAQESKDFSQNTGGLGIGLSIVKENTELLGGTILLETEKGKGSSFTVSLPVENSVRNTTEPSSLVKEQKNLNRELVILIAEDEEVNFLYLETILLDLTDYEVSILHAKNGKEAVEYCKQRSDINLILMDIKMPVMDGLEATRLIKSINTGIPVIAQTAYSTADDKQIALKSGCDFFISKPINDKELQNIIKSISGAK